jgi:hypothetical protein
MNALVAVAMRKAEMDMPKVSSQISINQHEAAVSWRPGKTSVDHERA